MINGFPKFDILKFLLEQETPEQDEQNQQNPGGEPGSPNQVQQQAPQQSNPFADAIGKTVKNIKFEKTGANSGRVMIFLAGNNVPLIISWANDKVTAYKSPSGDPVPL